MLYRGEELVSKQTHRVRTLERFRIPKYDAETWTIKTDDRERTGAFETSAWRIFRIQWMEEETNTSILKELNVQKPFSSVCYQRTVQLFRHIIQRKGNNLEMIILRGKLDGHRVR